MTVFLQLPSPLLDDSTFVRSLVPFIPPLWLRLAIGVSFFAVLATIDLARHGRAARKWREYGFLLVAVVVSLGYGILNDQLTVGLSPEYFAYGKGLADKLGPHFEQHPFQLRWEAAKVGMQATWSAGLIIGVAFLLANNPRPGLPCLFYKSMFKLLPGIVLACAVCATLLGGAGYGGLLTWLSEDFAEMLRRDQFRPRRFMAVYGIHLGGYIGGLIGTIVTVISLRRKRLLLQRGRQPAHSKTVPAAT